MRHSQGAKLAVLRKVYLIKYNPVLYSVLKPVQQHPGVPDKKVNALPICKTPVFRHQIKVYVVMGHGDNRFYAIFSYLVYQTIVKLKARLIGLLQ